MRAGAALGLAAALGAGPAFAHAGDDHGSGPGWTLDAWLLVLLGLSAGLYGFGAARLWLRSARGRPARLRHAAVFVAGWAALVVALVSPLHELGERLFTAHMIEHEILMVVAAPLLVMARPIGCMLWALPQGGRRAVGTIATSAALRRAWRLTTAPLVAAAVHGLAIWVWHMPALFAAALSREWIHWAQHLSFFVTAILFWWAVLRAGRREQNYGTAVFALFATVLHSGFLGALITFARQPLFPGQNAAAEWGLTALEDQQLAGLLMWVPGGIAYVLAGLALMGLWISSSGMHAYREPGDAITAR